MRVELLSRMPSVAVLLFAALAVQSPLIAADSAAGTLTVTGTVSSSISLTVESAGGAFSNAGPAAATTLGSVSKYGSAPAGFAITTNATTWTLGSTSGVGVKVVKANLASTTYTLSARLETPPPAGITWRLNSLALGAAFDTPLTLGGSFATACVYPWSIEVPDGLTQATTIDNVIRFTATSN